MIAGIRLDSTAIYDDGALYCVLGLSPDYSSGRIRARSCVEPPLARARSSGNGLDE
jgi:hypothetical protein